MIEDILNIYSQEAYEKINKKSYTWNVSFKNNTYTVPINIIKNKMGVGTSDQSHKACRLIITGDIVQSSLGLGKIFDIYTSIIKYLSYYYSEEEVIEKTELIFNKLINIDASAYSNFIFNPKSLLDDIEKQKLNININKSNNVDKEVIEQKHQEDYREFIKTETANVEPVHIEEPVHREESIQTEEPIHIEKSVQVEEPVHENNSVVNNKQTISNEEIAIETEKNALEVENHNFMEDDLDKLYTAKEHNASEVTLNSSNNNMNFSDSIRAKDIEEENVEEENENMLGHFDPDLL